MKKAFFVAVFVGTVVFGGVRAYSLRRVSTRSPQSYFETGKKFYDEGKFSEAAIEFLNALKKDPESRDSRYYLALSYLNQQDPGAAVRQLKAIVEAHPDDVPANLKLGNIYIEAGPANADYYRQAKEIASAILSKEPENVEALILSGNALNGLKDFPASAELFQKATSLESHNVAAWIGLGTSWALRKNLVEAEKAFISAREADPTNKSALISLANFYRVAGDSAKAEAVFKQALLQYPADRAIYTQAADFYATNKRYSDVEGILRAAQAANATDPAPTIDLSDFYRSLNRLEDARKVLLEAKPKFPANVQLSIKIASNLLSDKPDQARQEIDQILKAEPKNPAGHVLQGELQFRSGQFEAAEQTLGKEPALSSRFPEAHYLLGNLAARKGKNDEAEEHYRKALNVNRAYVPARVALATRYMAKGKLDDARGEVRQILELEPSNLAARLMRTSIDMADKNYARAETDLASLMSEFPQNAQIQRQMAVCLTLRGRNVEAEKSFSRALELAPTEQSFRDLTSFYIQTKQLDRAAQKIKTVPDAQKQAFHYELLGMIAEQAGRPQDAENAYKEALKKDPNWTGAQTRLFDQYLQAGRFDDALRTLDAVAKKIPSAAIVTAMRAAIDESQGHAKEAEAGYRQALQADPTIDLAANNLAYMLAQEGRDLNTALGLAQQVQRRQPDNPGVADTLAWVYYKLDQLLLARDPAQFATSKSPAQGLYQYHLGEIYKKNSQKVEAMAALKKAVSGPKAYTEKELAEADLKELAGR